MYNEELYHHGIRGQKWGVRRYQNKYGALTAAGKKRRRKLEDDYDKMADIGSLSEKGKKRKEDIESEYKSLTGKSVRTVSKNKKALLSETKSGESTKPKVKPLSEMSDDELKAYVLRKGNEEKYRQYNPKQVSLGKKFVNSAIKDVVLPALRESSKDIVKSYITDSGKKALGINDKKKNTDEKKS